MDTCQPPLLLIPAGTRVSHLDWMVPLGEQTKVQSQRASACKPGEVTEGDFKLEVKSSNFPLVAGTRSPWPSTRPIWGA